MWRSCLDKRHAPVSEMNKGGATTATSHSGGFTSKQFKNHGTRSICGLGTVPLRWKKESNFKHNETSDLWVCSFTVAWAQQCSPCRRIVGNSFCKRGECRSSEDEASNYEKTKKTEEEFNEHFICCETKAGWHCATKPRAFQKEHTFIASSKRHRERWGEREREWARACPCHRVCARVCMWKKNKRKRKSRNKMTS